MLATQVPDKVLSGAFRCCPTPLLVWAETGLGLCLYLIRKGKKFSLHASAPLASLPWEAITGIELHA